MGLPRLIGMADEMFILQGGSEHDLMLLLEHYTRATNHGSREISPLDDINTSEKYKKLRRLLRGGAFA